MLARHHPGFFNETSLGFGNSHYISTFRNASWILGPRVDPKKYRIDECGVGKHIQYFNCVHQDFEGAGKFETQLSQKNRTKNNHSFINQPYKQNHWCWLVPIELSAVYTEANFLRVSWVWKTPRCWRARTAYHSTTTASNRHFWEDGSLRILQRQMMMILSSNSKTCHGYTICIYTHMYIFDTYMYIYIFLYNTPKNSSSKTLSLEFSIFTPIPGREN